MQRCLVYMGQALTVTLTSLKLGEEENQAGSVSETRRHSTLVVFR